MAQDSFAYNGVYFYECRIFWEITEADELWGDLAWTFTPNALPDTSGLLLYLW